MSCLARIARFDALELEAELDRVLGMHHRSRIYASQARAGVSVPQLEGKEVRMQAFQSAVRGAVLTPRDTGVCFGHFS